MAKQTYHTFWKFGFCGHGPNVFLNIFGTTLKGISCKKEIDTTTSGSNPNWGAQFGICHIPCHGILCGVQWIRSSNASQQLDWWLHWHCLFHYSSSDHTKFGMRIIKCTNTFHVWACMKEGLINSIPKNVTFVLESEQIEIYNCLVNMDLNVELVN